MKRILLLIFLCLTLISCGVKTDGNPFSPFTGAIEATVNAVFEGESSSFVYRSEDGSIEFISPAELSGYVMRPRADGSVTLSYGEIEIPLSGYAGRLALATRSAFTPSEAEIASITAEETGGEAITAVGTDKWTYRFRSDGSPVSITGVFDGASLTLTLESVSRVEP